jgi:hypothetical protein
MQAMIDTTGATAGSVPNLTSVQMSAGQVVFVITNSTATTLTTAIKIYFLVITAGNPN